MDALLELLLPFVDRWRVGIAALVGIILAVILAILIPPFTGAYGIALVLLSLAIGFWWDASSRA